ncbi:hypothetical protein D3C80_2128880 [compost metagenome]
MRCPGAEELVLLGRTLVEASSDMLGKHWNDDATNAVVVFKHQQVLRLAEIHQST